LGLAIVKRAIEWHGGEVVLDQSPLGGARFCATWPIKGVHHAAVSDSGGPLRY
jgi:two-component system, OmpR family, sensor kinase